MVIAALCDSIWLPRKWNGDGQAGVYGFTLIKIPMRLELEGMEASMYFRSPGRCIRPRPGILPDLRL